MSLSLIFCKKKLLTEALETTKPSHSLGFRTTLFGDFYSVLDFEIENRFAELAELITWKINILTKLCSFPFFPFYGSVCNISPSTALLVEGIQYVPSLNDKRVACIQMGECVCLKEGKNRWGWAGPAK